MKFDLISSRISLKTCRRDVYATMKPNADMGNTPTNARAMVTKFLRALHGKTHRQAVIIGFGVPAGKANRSEIHV
jgi:hypothetical protein